MRFSGLFKSRPSAAASSGERDWVRDVNQAAQRREPHRRVLGAAMVRTQLSASGQPAQPTGREPEPAPVCRTTPYNPHQPAAELGPRPQGMRLQRNPGSGVRPLPTLGNDGPARLAVGTDLRSYSDPTPRQPRLDTTDMESSVIDENTEWQIKMAVARAVAAQPSEAAPVFPGMGGDSIDAAEHIVDEMTNNDFGELSIGDEDDTLLCDLPCFE